MERQYVAGWDGVRALAVAAVIAFHLDADWLPGGFLGVTTFFVLAGALATYRIGGEVRDTGTFDWRRYASGRIRRLLPALCVYVAVIAIWVWIEFPEAYPRIAGDAVAALLYVTPWREMASELSYQDAFSAGPEPLIHTWSLGIEEAAWILSGVTIVLSRRPAAAALSTGVLGLAGYVLWFGDPDLYYSPARLLEFAIGAVLGLVMTRRQLEVRWPVGLAGLVAMAVAMAAWEVDEVYEGGLVVAALASLALVASATSGPIGRALSIAPLRWLGTRSYSVYLWHLGFIELTDLGTLEVLGLTAAAAELSYRFVENPARRRSLLPGRLAPLLVGATLVLVLVTGAGPRPDLLTTRDAAAAAIASAPSADTTEVTDTAAAVATTDDAVDVCAGCAPSPVAGGAAIDLSLVFTPNEADPVRIAVVGDSVGQAIAIAVKAWGEVTGEATVDEVTVDGCTPLAGEGTGWTRIRRESTEDNRRDWTGCSPDLSSVDADVDLVLVVETGAVMFDHLAPDGRWTDLTDPVMQDALLRRYTEMAEQATDLELKVVVANAPPTPGAPFDTMRDADRVDAYNAVIGRSGLPVYDLATPIVAGDYIRHDGVHLHVGGPYPVEPEEHNEGFRYAADIAAPALVSYARQTS